MKCFGHNVETISKLMGLDGLFSIKSISFTRQENQNQFDTFHPSDDDFLFVNCHIQNAARPTRIEDLIGDYFVGVSIWGWGTRYFNAEPK